jgi:S-adenosylmethionine synthetase
MSYLLTLDPLFNGHPDKVAAQISEVIIFDEFISYDKNSKIVCETLETTVCIGERGKILSLCRSPRCCSLTIN